ncbi:hypothetical protein [Cohnella massiliensis]|uniref:hypothetical protein n=1 Tax=Cohnella massiliensis TaxID=1816691 RepID=UPI0009BBD947|nr:hypothetical protein [Cohnella massiliensis]
MKALLRYFFRDYLRSIRYLPSFLAFAIVLIVVYSVAPNPVMNSYSFTAVWLFLAMAWMAYGYIDAENETQQMVTVLHAGNAVRYYRAKLLLIMLIGAALAVGAVAYPAILDKFDRPPDLSELTAALTAHIAIAWLGIGCASLFSSKLIGRKQTSLIGLLLVLALAIAGFGVSERLPELIKFVAWSLPPAFRVMDVLIRFDERSAGGVAFTIAFAALYSLALMEIACRLMKRKLF